MKKIFTFMAAAAVAVSVNAQEIYWAVGDANPEAGQVIESVTGIKAVLGGEKCVTSSGGDNTALVWKDNKSGKITVEGCEFTHYSISGDNARGENFVAGTSARVYGGFAKFEPSVDGDLWAVFYIPDNKNVIFSEVTAANTDGVNLLLNGTAEVYNNAGVKLEVSETGMPDQTYKKTLGYIKCALKAGNDYYLSLDGSKLGFGGFVYKTAQGAAVEAINAIDENAPIYNAQGVRVNADAKGLLIQNGKKIIRK